MMHRTLAAGVLASGLVVASCGGTSSHRPASTVSVTPSTGAPGGAALPPAFLQATRAMLTTRSFRFVVDVSRATGAPIHLVGEFSAPDHIHEVVTGAPQGAVELAFIGAKAYRKRPDGHWVENGAATAGTTAASPAGDPRATFAVLADANEVTGSGPAYQFVLTGTSARRIDGAASKIEGSATVSGRTIASLTYQGNDPGATKVAIQYLEVGTAPDVTAPRVG